MHRVVGEQNRKLNREQRYKARAWSKIVQYEYGS